MQSLLESLSNYIHYNTTMKSHKETHGITFISYHSHVSLTNDKFIKHNNLMPISNQPTMIHDFIQTKLINYSPIISYRTYPTSFLSFLK